MGMSPNAAGARMRRGCQRVHGSAGAACMTENRNVYLIGPMGSGKTAVGRQLAKLLHLEFYDSDVEVERRTGVDIPYIFDREGEAGFREREREVIDWLTQLT